MRASELAYQAALVMSERGHCKNELEDEAGQVCFSGALMAVAFGDASHYMKLDGGSRREYFASEGYRLSHEVFRAAGRILEERLIRHEGFSAFPVMFNNDKRTTGEDVILLLKESAARLEGEGK